MTGRAPSRPGLRLQPPGPAARRPGPRGHRPAGTARGPARRRPAAAPRDRDRGFLPAARRRQEEGTLTLFTAIVAIALLAAVAFTVDAGQKLAAAAQARGLAAEAARAGAGQVSAAAAYAGGGPFTLSPQAAVQAAQAYLSRAGHSGSVTVTGPATIQVTVTVTAPAFPGLPGITGIRAEGTAAATLTQGVTAPQGTAP